MIDYDRDGEIGLHLGDAGIMFDEIGGEVRILVGLGLDCGLGGLRDLRGSDGDWRDHLEIGAIVDHEHLLPDFDIARGEINVIALLDGLGAEGIDVEGGRATVLKRGVEPKYESIIIRREGLRGGEQVGVGTAGRGLAGAEVFMESGDDPFEGSSRIVDGAGGLALWKTRDVICIYDIE